MGHSRATERSARSKPFRFAFLLSMLGVLLFGFQLQGAATHNIDDVELDGNAVDEAAAADDWDTILGFAAGAPSDLKNVFIADGSGTTIFTTGGSKDDLDIPNWQCTNGNVPDKDDILNAYAAAYNGSGSLKLYFGADRFANNGDAQIGFWFLQDETVNCDPNASAFTGQHEIGDLLVLSNFTQGGNISTIRVYTWVGSGGDTNDVLDLVAQGVDCAGAGSHDVCATVNGASAPAPGPFTPKSGPAGSFPAGSFYEGGVNLGNLPVDFGCGGKFLAETRSSQSVDAQLKDYALGSFELCDIGVEKTGDELSKAGDTVSYTVTITNSGAIVMYKDSIDDTLAGDLATPTLNPNVSNFNSTCGADLDPMESCTITYDYEVQGGDPDPLDNTVTVVYDSDAGLAGDEDSASADHAVELFQPGIDVTKAADTELSKEGDVIGYTITIDNTSSADSPDLVFDAIDDTVAGDLLAPALNAGVANFVSSCGATLAAQTSCQITYDYTVQPGDPDPLDNTVSVETHPENFPNDIDDSASDSVNLFQPGIDVTKDGDPFTKIDPITGVGDTITYSFTITNTSSADSPNLQLVSVIDTGTGWAGLGDLTADALAAGCDDLAPAAGCNFSVDYQYQPGDPDPDLENTVEVIYNPAGFPNEITNASTHNVTVIHPDFGVSKSCLSEPVPPGASANFRIFVWNTGDVPLVVDILDPVLGINLVDLVLPVWVDGGIIGVPEAGEVGVIVIEAGVIAGGEDITNEVWVTATLPALYELDNVMERHDDATCEVDGGATRTLGFWKTHEDYATHVLNDHLGGTMDLGWKFVDSPDDLFGIFWASPSHESDGSKRKGICRTKLQASWQLAAAILNSGLDNGAAVPIDPVTGDDIITAAQDALSGNNRREIIRLAGLLGGYNESGDEVAIVDGDGTIVLHADPNAARDIADLSFADC